ncbi:autotransporter assembly complex protein TamB [Candidatus Williamhamiltonella defendens]|uniref:autotransporter assembly complex protein TamB n=1 Tax=Candidatus Williamhamiltonella defendens TaxID=138072 RepID=UPI00130EBA0F
MRRIKKFTLGFFLVFLLLCGILWGLICTTGGLHFLIKNIVDWVPGLSIKNIEGKSNDLTLKGIQYQMPGFKLKIKEIHLALYVFCQTSLKFCIDDFTLNDLDMVIETKKLPSTEKASDQPFTNLRIFYPLFSKNLRFINLNVTIDDTHISLANFRTQADLQGRTLSLISPQLSGLLVSLPKSLEKLQAPALIYPVKSNDQTTATEATRPLTNSSFNKNIHPDLLDFFAQPILSALPDFHFPLNIQIKKLIAEQLRIVRDTDIVINSLQLEAKSYNQHFQVNTLKVSLPFGSFSVHGEANFADQWPIALKIDSLIKIPPLLKEEKIQLNLTGKLKKQLKFTADFSGSISAQLNATTTLSKSGLPLMMTLTSSQLQWPFKGDPEYKINNLQLQLNGKATDYALSLTGNMKSEELPHAEFSLDGRGNLQQFHLILLRLKLLKGQVDLLGIIDWSKTISWDSILMLKGIDTKKQWPEWPAQFNGKISTRGTIDGERWQLQIPDMLLKGELQNKPFKVSGSLKDDEAGQCKISSFNIDFGNNKLKIKGDLTHQWVLDMNIDAPKLQDGLPSVSGQLKGILKLRGDLIKPKLEAHFIANQLKWKNFSIYQIKLDAKLHFLEHIKGQFVLQVEKLKQSDFMLHHLMLNAKGTEKQHQLALQFKSEPLSGNFALQGDFNRQKQIWDLKLNKTDIRTLSWNWHLNHPTSIKYFYHAQKVTIQPHCLENIQAKLCLADMIEATKSGGQMSMQLNRFDLAMLKPFLSSGTSIFGHITGDAKMKWTAEDHLPTVQLALVGHDVKIRQNIADNPLNIVFNNLKLGVQLSHNKAQINTLISLKNNGQMQLDLKISDLQGKRTLSGKIDIDQISLEPINTVLDKNETITGVLNSHLDISGNLKNLLLYGDISLNHFSIHSSWMPVNMASPNHLLINFKGTKSTLRWVIITEKSQINLLGNANWDHIDDWRANLSAKGDQIRVTCPPIVKLDISPDILFEARPKLVTLKGFIEVPWARIKAEKIPPNVVDVSSYKVMLNDQLQPIIPQKTAMPINTHLNIKIGNDVALDAFGLKAQLQGTLKVEQDQYGIGLQGQINTSSGSFHAYGQDLLVKKGHLIFSGPTKPFLNIEAIRNPKNITPGYTAGIRVTGNANTPKIEVFSDPVLPKQEALSYLLRGQAIDQSYGTDSSLITSMLINMGILQTENLIGEIGGAFGISRLTLDTHGVGNDSQVVVSGYLNKNLQLKYGVDIFDSLATLTLRYQLMPRLYLEAISGIGQALDLLYHFGF